MLKKRVVSNLWDNQHQSVREKFLSLGASALSDAEILSLLLGAGNSQRTPLELATQLLEDAQGSLVSLSRMTPAQINISEGIGASRAILVSAALELGRRRQAEGVMHKEKILGSRDIIDLFSPLLRDLPHEEVWLLLLTGSKRIIDRVLLSKGGSSNSAVDIRVVARIALERKASGVVLVHNHPHGDPTPSSHDIDITRRVSNGLMLLDIRLLDHIIIGDSASSSCAELGLL
ncbi:MAG: DNA repair protein RadC [Rikenellaceae bacterium]